MTRRFAGSEPQLQAAMARRNQGQWAAGRTSSRQTTGCAPPRQGADQRATKMPQCLEIAENIARRRNYSSSSGGCNHCRNVAGVTSSAMARTFGCAARRDGSGWRPSDAQSSFCHRLLMISAGSRRSRCASTARAGPFFGRCPCNADAAFRKCRVQPARTRRRSRRMMSLTGTAGRPCRWVRTGWLHHRGVAQSAATALHHCERRFRVERDSAPSRLEHTP